MECLESFANIVGNLAEWANVLVTIAAVGAALWAAYWAKRAYVAQEKQSIASRRQLRLAYKQQKVILDQEKRRLEGVERERRALGLYLEVTDHTHGYQIQCTGVDKISPMIHPIVLMRPLPENYRGAVMELAESIEPLYIAIYNKNSDVSLHGWETEAVGLEGPYEIELYKVEHIAGTVPNIPIVQDGFVMSVRGILPSSFQFKIQFETGAGFVDTQIYEVTLPRLRGVIRRAYMRRIDPTSIPNPDIDLVLDGEDPG